MRKLSLFTLLMLSIFAISAQNSIRGKVIDENNQALIGAVVTLKQTNESVITNRQGEFEFNNLTDYAYSLAAKYIGYENVEQIVQTGSSTTIKMDDQKSVSLDEITVSAIRAGEHSPVAYANVSKDEINKRNLGQDLPYLLSLTPSMIVTSDAGTGIGYTGFRIRGTDANRINVTINGVPLNDSESHGIFLVNMPDFASSVNSVQVQRGVGTSTNGAAAFGASINMQTEMLNPSAYAELGTSVGSFGTMKNTVKAGTGLINGFAVDARLSNLVSDGYIDRAYVKMKSYFVSAGYYGENTMLKFITFGGNQKTHQAWNGVDLDLVASDPSKYTRSYNEIGIYTAPDGKEKYFDQTDNYNQTHYQLHFVHALNPNLNINAALHYTRGIGFYEDYKSKRKYKEYDMTPAVVNGETLDKTDLVRQKWLDNHFGGATFSLNYKLEKLAFTLGGAGNKYFGDHYGFVKWALFPNNLDVNHRYYFNKSTKTDFNVFTKASYLITDQLNVFVDLQYRNIVHDMQGINDNFDDKTGKLQDITQRHPFNFFNPKLGVSYQFDSKNSTFASFAMANREPNRNNYTDAGPNEFPTHETLYDTEIGYKYLSPHFSVGANAYYMSYKNQLILTGKLSEIGEALTTNIPESYRAGIELMAGAKIVNGLRWDGNVNLSQNKIKNFTEYVDEYDADWNWIGTKENFFQTTDISYSPNVVANSIFSYEIKGFETALYSTYVGRQFIDNTSELNRAIDPYFVNNLRLGYSWKMSKIRAIDFNLLVNNLFNTEYETNGWNWYTYYLGGERINEKRYFPQAGINFLFSTTIRL
ncbi:MAG: TonB-dependent receptor [Porphyromonadaceae bacterium]|nr:TonB-dependent receptor [Porphyromonadaceae bacterium]